MEDPQETGKRYFRASKRLLLLNGSWYFSTREGDHGPFRSREEAELQLQRFKEEMSELQNFQSNRAIKSEERAKVLARSRAASARFRETRNDSAPRDNSPEVFV